MKIYIFIDKKIIFQKFASVEAVFDIQSIRVSLVDGVFWPLATRIESGYLLHFRSTWNKKMYEPNQITFEFTWEIVEVAFLEIFCWNLDRMEFDRVEHFWKNFVLGFCWKDILLGSHIHWTCFVFCIWKHFRLQRPWPSQSKLLQQLASGILQYRILNKTTT